MGCDAGPTLNRIGWVGLHCVYQVHRIEAYTDLSAVVAEGIGILKIYLSPWFFQYIYPGHLGFWPMRKPNTAMFTKY